MTQAHSQAHHASVLIIDRSQDWAADLSNRLAPLNLKVHVVGSREAALLLAQAKKIDVAVMEYAIDSWTVGLERDLRGLKVPTIYAGTPQDVLRLASDSLEDAA
jgi:CheY-like chemotaxis protein